jgi:hypothetical protein
MDAPAILPAPVSAPPHRRRRLALLTFSIRELLLLTTTAAALVALFLAYYRDSRPFVPSPLLNEFGSAQQIRAAAARLHPAPMMIVNGGGGGSGNADGTTREYQYSIELPRAARGQFMTTLHQDALRMLDEDSRTLRTGTPRYHGSADGGNDLRGFSYRYQGDGLRGVIVVRRVDISDEEMQLTSFIYEHPDR